MNKKKLTLCLVFALLLLAVVGATLAYFTDSEEKKNVFTVGNIDIELIEEFTSSNAILIPGNKNTNAINKDVYIKNTGKNDAFVWYEWYIPTALDPVDDTLGATNIVHVNSKGAYWDKYYTNPTYGGKVNDINLTWDHDANEEINDLVIGPDGFICVEEIDGIKYNRYVSLYHGVLKPGETTSQGMDQVYLDFKVDCTYDEQTEKYTWFTMEKGKKNIIDYPLENGVNIIVKGFGIQADLPGIDKDNDVDVYDAFRAYYLQTATSSSPVQVPVP